MSPAAGAIAAAAETGAVAVETGVAAVVMEAETGNRDR